MGLSPATVSLGPPADSQDNRRRNDNFRACPFVALRDSEE
jgi:hypothetical protein